MIIPIKEAHEAPFSETIVTSNWRGERGEFTSNLVAKPLDTQGDPGADEGHNSTGLPMLIGSITCDNLDNGILIQRH